MMATLRARYVTVICSCFLLLILKRQLLTGYDQLMLAEFVYGLKPKETFAELFGIDQIKPRKVFYHLKKVSEPKYAENVTHIFAGLLPMGILQPNGQGGVVWSKGAFGSVV
jgi:hypothetical protein